MNRQQLAYELDRYLRFKNHEPPPSRPVASSDNPSEVPSKGTNGEGNGSQSSTSDQPQDETREQQSSTDPERLLNELTDEAQGCQLCGLSENRQQVVFGQGSADASVMVIGEGPGAREDEQGVPFVGEAGKLLRGGFQKVGLNEANLYITNTVKCRPPGNRNPTDDELEACRPYLDKQIEYVDPDVVLSLGNFALRYCLGEDNQISTRRGARYEWQECTLIPTYHPAYILRNSNQSGKFFADLKLVEESLGRDK